jgi:signal transduction histidine kinase
MFTTKNIFLVLLLAVLYYGAGNLSFDLITEDTFITMGAFMPEGIALAFALFFGKRALFGIFLGQLALAIGNDISLFPSLAISFINTSEAYLAIILFDKFKINKELISLRDVIGFALIVSLVLQVYSSVASNLVLLFFGYNSTQTLMHLIFSWWFGNSMGQLLVAPFLLIHFYNYKKINIQEYIFYVLAIVGYLYTIEIVIEVNNPFLFSSLSIPVALFFVAKKNMLYGTLFIVLAAMVTSYSAYLGIGSFQLASDIDNTINYNLFILSHISIVMMFGALFEERRQRENRLQHLVEQEVDKNKEQQLLMLQQNRHAQMGELISMIAHQWRQPLNNLSLVNQVLITKYKKSKLDDESMESFKNNSSKQITLMSQTIDDFRDFFRDKKEKKYFSVNEAIQTVLSMTKDIYKKNGIEIDFVAAGSYKVNGLENTFGQALLNIINNARDALIEKNIEEKRITILLAQEDDTVLIQIKDNAGGIPKKIIEKIFDPYFSTKQNKNGTGLGLYMTRVIINEQENASVSVSNDAEGAVFSIKIKGEIDVDK